MGTSSGIRLGLAVLAAGVGLATSMPAQAAGRLLRGEGGAASVLELRLARAASDDWTRLWAQYRLNGTGRAAIVTPVAPGTFVDPTGDAWFEALETATAPRVVPPVGAALCGATQSTSVDVTGDVSPTTTLAPTQVAVLSGLPEVLGFAAVQELVISSADQAALEKQPGPFVALVYQLDGKSALTQPVRFSTRGLATPLALPLVASDSRPDVTLFTIGQGRARISGATEHTPDALGFAWQMLLGQSDYVEQRRGLLAEDDGKSWLVETAGSSPLYHFSILPNQAGSIPPVVQIYFERSIAEGTASGSVQKCLDPIWDAQALGKTGAIVADPCPAGALAIVPALSGAAPACNPAPSAGQIEAMTLACGSADDLAHALAGGRADLASITRARSVAGSQSEPASIELHAGSPLPRVLTAPVADMNGCLPQGNTGTGGSWGGSGGGTGASGYPGDPGYSDPYHPGGYEDDVHTDVSVSCSGSSEPGSSNDSCSGDSSSSSEDDACSGDSSSSSDGGDSCSGDSSTSSGDSGDACAGDSSDGYGSSDGCASDSSADSGCSGGDASASGGDCNLSRRRTGRPKPSLWLLISAAIALPLRRRRRDLAAGRRRTH